MIEGAAEQVAPVFKKRAKPALKRRRNSEAEDDANPEPHLSVAEILKQRRQSKVRRAALTISNDEPVHEEHARPEEEVGGVRNRFVPQTGQVVGTYDKQMDEYVDAKMAEFRGISTSHTPSAEAQAGDLKMEGGARQDTRYSATAGKIVEVDLGETQTLSNIARTDAARRRLEGGMQAEEHAGKVRLGKDGKPFRSRRRRRNSEDLARDALVDSVLRETPLSIFGELTHQQSETKNQGKEMDEDAVMERFKSNYHEHPENSNRPARKPPVTTAAGGKVEERKGPRLGGSKNARIRMLQEQAAAKKKS